LLLLLWRINLAHNKSLDSHHQLVHCCIRDRLPNILWLYHVSMDLFLTCSSCLHICLVDTPGAQPVPQHFCHLLAVRVCRRSARHCTPSK
jgi:hypothetical protein